MNSHGRHLATRGVAEYTYPPVHDESLLARLEFELPDDEAARSQIFLVLFASVGLRADDIINRERLLRAALAECVHIAEAQGHQQLFWGKAGEQVPRHELCKEARGAGEVVQLGSG